jgi:hypothetical protein
LKNIKKEGSLGRRNKTFEKKMVSTGFLPSHLNSGLTRQVDRFILGHLQIRILNETDSAKAPCHPKKFKKNI